MYIIAGLGNPGKQYYETKHNIGFKVIDRLSEDYNISVTKIKHKALIGDGNINGEKVIFIKPQTYMNLSGESIKEALNFYKISIKNFIVIYDDISLLPSMVRIREKGSAGGHNGIKSIIANLGTEEFLRIKVGIGDKPNGWDLADYVLSKFSKDDQPLIEMGIEKACNAVKIIFSDGVKEAMNRINQKNKL